MNTDMAKKYRGTVATDLIPLSTPENDPDFGRPKLSARRSPGALLLSRQQYRDLIGGRGGHSDPDHMIGQQMNPLLIAAGGTSPAAMLATSAPALLKAQADLKRLGFDTIKDPDALFNLVMAASAIPGMIIRNPAHLGAENVMRAERMLAGRKWESLPRVDKLAIKRATGLEQITGGLSGWVKESVTDPVLKPRVLERVKGWRAGDTTHGKYLGLYKDVTTGGRDYLSSIGEQAYAGVNLRRAREPNERGSTPLGGDDIFLTENATLGGFGDTIVHEGTHLGQDVDSKFRDLKIPYGYRRSEIEARITERRAILTPEERANSLMEESQNNWGEKWYHDEMKLEQQKLQQAAKGGHVAKGGNAPDLTGMSNFLATDKVPDTLFGIPVVSRREDYTEADLRFFKDHPKAGGYYDMGEEAPEDVGAEGPPVQADKAGISEAAAYEIERRNAADAAYASRYVEGEDSTVVPTGRMVEELVYDPSGRQPGDIGYEDPKDVIAGLPKTSYERGGKYYQKVPEKIDRLALTTGAERDALAKIQAEFRAVRGRDMDNEVAAIRAKLSAGTIQKDEARQLARTLCRSRDIKAAKAAAFQFWSETGAPNGKHPRAMAESDWKRFYVNTEKLGVLAAKHGIQSVVDVVNTSPEGSLYDIMNRTIARRFGLEEVLEDRDIMVRNPELDIPANYSGLSRGRKAAAKRIAMKIADGADGINNAARRTAAKKYLDRVDIRQINENNYEGLNKGIPFEVKKGTKKVRTGRYRARHADMGGGRTVDDLDSFTLHADNKGGDAYADRAIAAMRDVLPFIKAHEGFRGNAYKDTQGVVWTVGYGQTTINGRPVKEGDTISEKDASAFVWQRIRENAYSMYKQYPWMEKLSQNALAAAYDLAYNLGDGIFTEKNSPGFKRRLAAGEDPEKVLWSEYGTYLGGKDATAQTRKGLKNRRDDAVKKWKE